MNSADEMPAKIDAPGSTSAPADFGQKLDEHASVSDLGRASDQHRPVEDLHSLLLRISHHLDYETSERSTIYYRLLALDAQAKRIENQTKTGVLRALVRYFVVICFAVAGTMAWQSYGEATKQIVATKAPELGWSPEAKQMIASWVQELGWTKPQGARDASPAPLPVVETPQGIRVIPVAQTASDAAATKEPAAPSIDPEQVQQIARSLTALQQSVEQLSAAQDQMAHQITSLQAANSEILNRIPAPPPLPPVAPARKPTPAPLHVPRPPGSGR
jgi:type IV secretory pathway VirJ component